MKNAITFIVLLLVMVIGLVSFPVELGATPGDIKARMRLYEGFRGDSQQPEKVISSYYLKSISGRYTFSHKEEAKESATLKRVFNLSKVKLITDAMMRLREGEQESPFQVIVLNGRELLLQLRLLDGPNNLFRMEVLEKGKSGKRSLFKGTILLPQAKATALGFEDSAGKIYFLAFQRDKDHPSSKARTRDGKPMIMPKLIRKVQPKYPKEALENKIQGVVVLEAMTDAEGDVVEVKAINGHPLLRESAKEALKQWKYEPYLIDGKKKPVKFTVVIKFNLDKKKKKDKTK